jgi:hypothetical protein
VSRRRKHAASPNTMFESLLAHTARFDVPIFVPPH